MANNRKQMNWLLEQLPLFRDRGLIDPVSEEKLRNHCLAELSAAENRNYYPLALSIAGTILIAGGIILLLNYNWDMFPKTVRITIAFLPILLGAAVSFFACGLRRTLNQLINLKLIMNYAMILLVFV